MNVIGIDPGKGGGFCFVSDEGPTRSVTSPFRDVGFAWRWLKVWAPQADLVVCEAVHAFRTDGRASAFAFGYWTGVVHGLVHSLTGALPRLASPREWQRYHGLYGRDFPSKTAKKNYHKEVAAALLGRRVTHATADAVLIAHFGLDVLALPRD